jgi:hypothetical protein
VRGERHEAISGVLERHRELRRRGAGIVSVLVDPPDTLVRALGGEILDAELALSRWCERARELARARAIERISTETDRSADEVRTILALESAESTAMIERGASAVPRAVELAIRAALGRAQPDLDALEALDIAWPWLVLHDPEIDRAKWALAAVERCPSLPIVFVVRDVNRYASALSGPFRDRWSAGLVAIDRAEVFERSATPYEAALRAVRSEWTAAAAEVHTAPADRARSIAERLLHRALEAITETRGVFTLNYALESVAFGPRDVEIDLAARELQVAVEVDGYFHFRDEDAYRRDRRKDVLLQRHGWLVLRVLATDVVDRLGETVSLVIDAVRFARQETQ